jgi:hypothetical protein
MTTYVREFVSSPMIRFVMLVAAISLILSVLNWNGARTFAAILAGAVVYMIIEYAVHRYLLHEYPKLLPFLYEGHVKHHQEPKNLAYLFSPLRYDAAIYVLYAAALWAVFRDLSAVAPVIAGTSLYQLYYQWMHYASHRPITPATRWGRWMKKKHLLHHYLDDQSWYGVSHPVMDYMLSTHKPKSAVRNPGGAEAAESTRMD